MVPETLPIFFLSKGNEFTIKYLPKVHIKIVGKDLFNRTIINLFISGWSKKVISAGVSNTSFRFPTTFCNI